MRATLPRFQSAMLALAGAVLLPGCAQYAPPRAEWSTLTVVAEAPPQAGPATRAPLRSKPRIARARPVATKLAATKPAATYRPAGHPPEAIDDEASCAAAGTCAAVLKSMLADPERTWMQHPA